MKKIDVEKIIAVSGLPGLFKIISNGTKGVIVENLIDKKRTIVLNNNKIFTLETVRMYTTDSEKPVSEILFSLHENLNGGEAPHHKTASDEDIVKLFEKILPDYDKERVFINNMRKLMQWYNTLYTAKFLNIVEEKNEESSDKKEDSKSEQKTKAKKTETAKSTEETTEEAPKKRGRKKKTENE